MGRQALIVIAGPVCAALEAGHFVFTVNTRFNGKCFAIMQAGADDDIEHPRAIHCNCFECFPNCIESELTGHDLPDRWLGYYCKLTH
jgi:hypothetical protein